MKHYTKIIGVTGAIYTTEFEKIKHHVNKIREVREDTVVKVFKAGKATIRVVFEETGKEMTLDDFSDPELIKKFLGKKFI